jgi:DNA-directed RNA polymerase subunit beta
MTKNKPLERINFGQIKDAIDIPHLIEVQMKSYSDFLQSGSGKFKSGVEGLEAVFREVFPIESYDEKIKLDFVDYEIQEAKMSALEALREGETYAAPLYVTFRLDNEGSILEEKVYMGELPMMTDRGTFIINGAERVVVSQLHRSPGICFESSLHANGKTLYSFRIIPDRGSWLEVTFDTSDLLWVHLDRRKRRRKFLVTTFLRALGYSSNEEIIGLFYQIDSLNLKPSLDEDELSTKVLIEEIRDTANEDLVVARAFEPLSKTVVRQLLDLGIKSVEVVDITNDDTIIRCLKKDPTRNTEEALKDIYKRLRPGDPPTVTNAKALLKRLFFDPKRYDIGRVGRYKINQKLTLDIDIETRILCNDDIVAATSYVINLRQGEGTTDDIDHLGSRRIRAVGELLANQCRTGLARTERLVKERMTLFDVNTEGMTPQKLINPKALSAVIRDFFGRSQLSQLMDQTNPLSEVTHKRRLSALGPGGLSRDRAGFEVRDVHTSHYGRICPIETPEGPNIGLISSMSTFSRINEFGFLETPYRKVANGKVTGEIEYLAADQEEHYVIAQANAPIDDKGKFVNPKVSVRYRGDFMEVEPANVQLMDVSPKQLVSVAAGLIPFLEHDDANRALMGSNMQRQGVPLIRTDSPYVGTGMEAKVARDSKAVVVADKAGKVAAVDASQIIITKNGQLPEGKRKIVHDPDNDVYVYNLRKFMRSNAGTCINQKPIVEKGQSISKGQVIADGPCSEHGELALGRNVLVAFMPWNGYNFEDAIIISERLVKEDIYTSIHIDEFEISARDTKLGPEEITRDIPNVGDEALMNLGPDGVVRIGAEVGPGDILVGKITPKSETELAPEERLLRAIFGEKAADVKDSSLVVPSGTHGIVMDIKVTSGSVRAKSQKLSPAESKRQTKAITDRYDKRKSDLTEELTQSLSNILLNEKIPLDVVNAETGEILIPANRKITKTLLRKMAAVYDHIEIDPSPIRIKIREIIGSYENKFQQLENERDLELDRVEAGDDIDPGIIKQVKVYVASKRKMSVGDKMARPSREQGGGLRCCARGGHALHGRWNTGGHYSQPAGCAFTDECRSGA